MIAAIALSRELPLFTFNARDFVGTGVEIVDLTTGLSDAPV
jgi:predicted nucleic acid-binding protein